ncbi:MAG: hypothetical protein SP1CHLAM54_09460 [Chlamydiia bacterium]|nr:hypothetical protein [Chlamydiia bacterium]MCH9615852.1 hypothetical protein [Chlamydiia bacterium]MCH9628745.1 hypothetical protein [Chlamydiia bacterium]
MRKVSAMSIYGSLWSVIGVLLFSQGWRLLDGGVWIILGLAIGLAKGHFVLRKVAAKTMNRWQGDGLRFSEVWPVRFLVLMGMMMVLGFVLRFVPVVVRGVVDIAVGMALFYGAIYFFRRAYAPVGPEL